MKKFLIGALLVTAAVTVGACKMISSAEAQDAPFPPFNRWSIAATVVAPDYPLHTLYYKVESFKNEETCQAALVFDEDVLETRKDFEEFELAQHSEGTTVVWTCEFRHTPSEGI